MALLQDLYCLIIYRFNKIYEKPFLIKWSNTF